MSAALLDAIIVGAGAAGLAAARLLQRAGLRVICLEARERLGGRIHTLHDPLVPQAIELGAEFVHGRPPQILDLVSAARLPLADAAMRRVRLRRGRPVGEAEAAAGDRVLEDLETAAHSGRDESFQSFLDRSSYSESERRWSTAFVEGFNAAHAGEIGIASLAEDARAADQIEGDRQYRLPGGYDGVARSLAEDLDVRLGCLVERVAWRDGRVAVHTHAPGRGREVIAARTAVVTLPLGVLQADPGTPGTVLFDPRPTAILDAARALRFGQAARITLLFDRPFWEGGGVMLLSDEPVFPTWWTPRPGAPLIVGWSAGSKFDPLAGLAPEAVARRAEAALRRIAGNSGARLERFWYHDWHADPFARGAYSYVPPGALPVRRTLAAPVDGTLFFAGEATDTSGHTGTVHGAILSGERAARQVEEHLHANA